MDEDVSFLNAPMAGIFIQTAVHGSYLKEGEEIGRIVDPLRGEVLERITAPRAGILFTIREYPVVDEGSLIARVLNCLDPEEKRYKEGEWRI